MIAYKTCAANRYYYLVHETSRYFENERKIELQVSQLGHQYSFTYSETLLKRTLDNKMCDSPHAQLIILCKTCIPTIFFLFIGNQNEMLTILQILNKYSFDLPISYKLKVCVGGRKLL